MAEVTRGCFVRRKGSKGARGKAWWLTLVLNQHFLSPTKNLSSYQLILQEAEKPQKLRNIVVTEGMVCLAHRSHQLCGEESAVEQD